MQSECIDDHDTGRANGIHDWGATIEQIPRSIYSLDICMEAAGGCKLVLAANKGQVAFSKTRPCEAAAGSQCKQSHDPGSYGNSSHEFRYLC